jgi:hypothetical protein
MKPTNEIQRKCSNCGIPNSRGLFCPKCNCITFVGYQFDGYISEAAHRVGFLKSIEASGVFDLATLRTEASNRQKPLMHALATRIDNLTRAFPPDIAAEIFRRALIRSKLKAESMAKNLQAAIDDRNEAYRAVAAAMAGVTTEPKPKPPTAAERAYAGFDATDGEGESFLI